MADRKFPHIFSLALKARHRACYRLAMRSSVFFLFVLIGLSISALASSGLPVIIVSVSDQRLAVVENGICTAKYPVSTSKFGVGDRPRSFATPLGMLQVAAKVGGNAPVGAVFHGQRRTGEILRPNAPGRDPIVTRILHLRGLEAQNCRAFGRGIYIHGTAEERRIGRPASYGCIRMKSRDVVRLFDSVPVGAKVEIVTTSLSRALPTVVASL
jgi:lipoprotein-anchoring transpeptidase ErfK/SrfK